MFIKNVCDKFAVSKVLYLADDFDSYSKYNNYVLTFGNIDVSVTVTTTNLHIRQHNRKELYHGLVIYSINVPEQSKIIYRSPKILYKTMRSLYHNNLTPYKYAE